MERIGITGTIGSGKSSVGVILRGRGFPVLDADACVHELYRDCAELRGKLAAEFGEECLTPDGVDRSFFAARVFTDVASREKLESLVYPYLTDAVGDFFAANPGPVFLEAAVLHKVPAIVALLDGVWLVDAPATVRLERLQQRGLSREDAKRRIEAQGNLAALWTNAALPVIRLDNGGTPEQLEELVANILSP